MVKGVGDIGDFHHYERGDGHDVGVGEGGGEPTSTSTCVAQPSPAHAQIINYYGDAIVVMYVARQRQAGSEKKPGSVRSPYSRGACEATRRQRGTDN